MSELARTFAEMRRRRAEEANQAILVGQDGGAYNSPVLEPHEVCDQERLTALMAEGQATEPLPLIQDHVMPPMPEHMKPGEVRLFESESGFRLRVECAPDGQFLVHEISRN